MQEAARTSYLARYTPAVNLARLEAIYQQVLVDYRPSREGINLPVARWSSCVFAAFRAAVNNRGADSAISAEKLIIQARSAIALVDR